MPEWNKRFLEYAKQYKADTECDLMSGDVDLQMFFGDAYLLGVASVILKLRNIVEYHPDDTVMLPIGATQKICEILQQGA